MRWTEELALAENREPAAPNDPAAEGAKAALGWLRASVEAVARSGNPVLEATEGSEGEGEDGPAWVSDYAGVETHQGEARSLLWVARAAPASSENEDGSTDFIASTGSVDRVGDVIDQATWRLGPYRKNPVIMHEHFGEVVGRGTVSIKTGDDGVKYLALNVVWDDDEVNPQGQLDAHQHRAGFRHAVSVRFLPGKFQNRTELPADHPYYIDPQQTPRWRAGYLYSFCELLEVSSVAVPCNREALQLSMAARQLEGDDAGPLEGAKALLHVARSVGRDELEAMVAELVAKAVPEQLREGLRTDPQVRALVAAVYLGQPSGEPKNPNPTQEKRQGPSWTRS